MSLLTISAEVQHRFYPPARSVAAKLYGQIRRDLRPESVILDIGAGGQVAQNRNLKPYFQRVCGVDIDPIVLTNPCVHEGKLLNDDMTIPYHDETFDAAISDYVFEHLRDPTATLREVARVLRPGGRLFFRTINRWHYLCMISRCIPRRLSARVADTLGHAPVEAAKTHETFYRLNSPGQIRRHAHAAGLRVGQIATLETHPIYFRLFAPAWFLMVGAERIMNAVPLFAPMRMSLFGFLEKQAPRGQG